jgi:hypothetical protein
MWHWVSRSPRPRPNQKPWRKSLRYEGLEQRLCLSAASITGFSATPVSGNSVRVMGMVMDESPSTVSVQFSGVVSGSASPNSSGYFDFTTTASGLGTITAVAHDNEGLNSTPAYAQLTNQAPTITGLSVTETGNGTYVTVSGTVNDDAPGGRTVSLGGVASGSAQTSSNGYFSVSVQASSLGTVTATTTDVWGQTSPTAQATLTSPAPTIQNLSVQETTNGKMVSITGKVVDASPAGRTVTLGGVVNGQTTTNSSGNFSVTLEASALGQVTAQTTDVWGQSSSVAQVQLTSAAPSITTCYVESGPNRQITVSGYVTDFSPGGRTVTIGGVAGGTAVTNGQGYYSVTLTASGLGQLTATTQDVWGQSSNVATCQVQSNTPTITNFSVIEGPNNTAVISGNVMDEWRAGLVVVFGGVLDGFAATVDGGGSFSINVVLPANTSGIGTAAVTDWWENTSQTVQQFVDNSD